jgi:putative transposase
MSPREQEARLRAERARRVALFRYELIQEVIDPTLSTRQRGPMVSVAMEKSPAVASESPHLAGGVLIGR